MPSPRTVGGVCSWRCCSKHRSRAVSASPVALSRNRRAEPRAQQSTSVRELPGAARWAAGRWRQALRAGLPPPGGEGALDEEHLHACPARARPPRALMTSRPLVFGAQRDSGQALRTAPPGESGRSLPARWVFQP